MQGFFFKKKFVKMENKFTLESSDYALDCYTYHRLVGRMTKTIN